MNKIVGAMEIFFATHRYFLCLQDDFYWDSDIDVSESRITLLRIVLQDEGVNIKHIASKLKLTKPSVSVMVDKLIAEWWLVKKQNSKDKRSVCVHMTNMGKEKMRELKHNMIRAIMPSFQKLTEEEIVQFTSLLEKLQK